MKSVKIPEGLELESGFRLKPLNIAYQTYGTLNERQDNVVMVIHALTANAEVDDWWSGLFGVNKLFDPDKYFIICANNLGSPYGTTSPVTYRLPVQDHNNFPFFTIRDMAQAHQLFLETLGIENIHLLIGPSCGGNIAQEMAISLGERVRNLALLCCAARESPWVVAIHEAQRQALLIDENFKKGKGKGQGLMAARAMAMPFYRSHISFNERQSETDDETIKDFRAASYIAYQGQKFNNRFDAHCYYHLINALDTHHIGRGRGGIEMALSHIKARTLCMSFSSDILVPPIEQEILSQSIPNALHFQVETIYGHDAFLIEAPEVNRTILQFISESSAG